MVGVWRDFLYLKMNYSGFLSDPGRTRSCLIESLSYM